MSGNDEIFQVFAVKKNLKPQCIYILTQAIQFM